MGRGADDTILLISAALGAMTGIRSMAAPVLLVREMEWTGTHLVASSLDEALTSRNGARVLALLAGGEMLADKLPFVPARTAAVPLAWRALVGSLSAAAFAAERRFPVLPAAVAGGAGAIAAAFAAFHFRRLAGERLQVPDAVLGMAEDAVVLAAGRGITRLMRE